MWISGSGDYVSVSGDGNAIGYDFTTGGVTLGLDYRLSRHLAVGVAFGDAHTWTNLTGDGNIEANSGRAGLYAAFYQGGFYLNGYSGGGYDSYDTRFGPLATLQYTYVNIRGNTESGSLAPLQINSKSADSLRTNLGATVLYSDKVGKAEVTPSLRVSWQHEYLYSALPVTAQFAGETGNAFTVVGPSEGHDNLLINAGVDVKWTPTIGTYFGYSGQVGRSRYDSHGGLCSVHFDF